MFIFLLFVASAGGSMAVAQQDSNNQDQPLMTPVSGPVTNEPTDSRKFLVDQLDLRMYEAAVGDLSLCADDKICLKHAKRVKSWLCAASVCDGTDKSKEPIACFDGFSNPSIKVLDQIDASICPFIKFPSAETGRALLIHNPDMPEDDLIKVGASLLAIKRSVASCEDYIKNYVGPYGGPKWNYQWYRDLSGCRILAHKSTREQEERDFYTWLGVVQGLGNCSDIVNSEMRKACNAPGAISPAPVYEQ